ncbi:hypothetical protein VTO42DRAFT_2915 [Malbranchea cinnamomea]
MNKEPWLDGLTEDWIPDPQLSVSPGGTILTGAGGTLNIRRRSIPCWSDEKNYPDKQNEPNDKFPEDSSSKPIPSEKGPYANDDRLLQSQTIQIRNGNSRGPHGTPEWRRRILNGEVAYGESLDLFAPIGLEKIFDPPKPTTPSKIPRLVTSKRRVPKHPETPKVAQANGQFNSASNAFSPSPQTPAQGKSTTTHASRHVDQELRATDSTKVESLKQDFSGLSLGDKRNSSCDARMQTASGNEEIRNQEISPVLPAADDSALEHGDSADFSSIRIISDFYLRRASSASNGPRNTAGDQSELPEASLELTSQSLPEGLSMGTQDMSSVKGYINMRRGGCSDEESFFKRRLSPSSLPYQIPQSSIISSPIPGSSPMTLRPHNAFHTSQPLNTKPPALLNIPPPSSRSQIETRPKTGNCGHSGSPLKLFGEHDTFTNNKLLRRMDQFEKNAENIHLHEEPTQSDSQNNISRRRALLKQSLQSSEANNSHLKNAVSDKIDKKAAQSKKSRPENESAKAGTSDWLKRQKPEQVEMKRGRNSPTKDSSAKRRRTLQDHGLKCDMRDGPILNSSEFVSPNGIEASNLDGYREGSDIEQGEPSKHTSSHADRSRGGEVMSNRPTSRVVQTKIAFGNGRANCTNHNASSPRMGQVLDDSRKGSITTQDFLDEATRIMNFIRARGRPKNGLSSLIESEDLDQQGGEDGPCSDESSVEGFLKPPSREDSHVERIRFPYQPNPRIISHLKKFEEHDELDMFMGASAMSLRLRQTPGSALQSKTHSRNNSHDETGAGRSELEDLRIREAIEQLGRRNSSPDGSSGSLADDGAEPENQVSADRPVGTIPTRLSQNSSGSSGAKGIISSGMVSHLIPHKVGRMVYDHEKQTWVKGARDQTEMPSQVSADTSEEDPFRDIPDLSVDELQELITARGYATNGAPTRRPDTPDNTVNNETNKMEVQSQSSSRPATRDGGSSVQSKYTHFTGSCPKPDTRATSWATDIDIGKPFKADDAPSTTRHAEEVEHELRLHDGYISPISSRQPANDKQPRVVSITMSSNFLPKVHSSNSGDLRASDDGTLPAGVPTTSTRKLHPLPKLPDETPFGSIYEKESAIRQSVPKMDNDGGEISRIKSDRNEESAVDAACHELSMVRVSVNEGQSAISRREAHFDTSYSFHLSSLPDFTVHQVDESVRLELSYVAERTNPKSLRQVHGAFALAAETLIKHITDAEPFEACWEHLQQLNLRNKGLITLMKLNQFCPRLKELDASHNRLGQLNGVPSSIRVLNVAGNCLSSMTAWAHLSNLQYVDVSGNELENLGGFSGLVHLRSLKANNNKLRSLAGILNLDGLLSLEVRDNALEAVDFQRTELFRLKHLDLSGNQLSQVKNIHCLPALESLDVRNNRLRSFACKRPLQHLRFLKLSRNHIEKLDVSAFPSLQLLYVDGNCLSTIHGLDASENLDTVSMREQTCVSDATKPLTVNLDISTISSALRKLYLSSNKLSFTVLSPQSPVLNLQFLDLASCSLDCLPTRFGSSFPNLKGLNFNFNALADISPLEGITRLSKLSLVGNRITRLRRTCQVLRAVGGRSGTLRKVDLRWNPITVGFYPAPVLGSGKRFLLNIGEKNTLREASQCQNRADALPPLDGCADIALRAGADGRDDDAAAIARQGASDVDVEIDDQYTVPPADVEADRKYLVHLDEATRLKRRVVELMIHAATSGRLKVLDGLALEESSSAPSSAHQSAQGRGAGTGGKVKIKKDWVWKRLEELGVLQKRSDVGARSDSDGEDSEL